MSEAIHAFKSEEDREYVIKMSRIMCILSFMKMDGKVFVGGVVLVKEEKFCNTPALRFTPTSARPIIKYDKYNTGGWYYK